MTPGGIRLGAVARSRVRSLWIEEAIAQEGSAWHEELRDDIDCDVCVVGGGFVGMWTALRLKEQEPTASVVLLEADFCGSGASGRNAGFAMSLWQKIDTLVKQFGPEVAARIAHESQQNVIEIAEFANARGFDPHFESVGWILAAASESQLGSWDSFVARGEKLGAAPYEILSREQVQRRTGSKTFVGGVFDPTVATVQPALLAAGLRRAVIDSGVAVFEGTRVRRVDRDGRVTTFAGSVAARQGVVLSLGGWASTVNKPARALVTVASDVVATAPVDEALDRSGWVGREAITTARMTLRYARRTRDGRLVFGTGANAVAPGGRLTSRFDGADVDRRWYTREISHYFPSAMGAPVTHAWSGPVDRSADGLPYYGAISGSGPRIVYGSGFSGNGLAPSLTAGRILASLVFTDGGEWSRHPLVRPHGGKLPPEPFRTVGGELVRRAVHRVEDRDEAGKRNSPLVRKLADQAPSGLVTFEGTGT